MKLINIELSHRYKQAIDICFSTYSKIPIQPPPVSSYSQVWCSAARVTCLSHDRHARKAFRHAILAAATDLRCPCQSSTSHTWQITRRTWTAPQISSISTAWLCKWSRQSVFVVHSSRYDPSGSWNQRVCVGCSSLVDCCHCRRGSSLPRRLGSYTAMFSRYAWLGGGKRCQRHYNSC